MRVCESGRSQNPKCRELSNPEADLQLIAPPNRETFESRLAKGRKMNVVHDRPGKCASTLSGPRPCTCYAQEMPPLSHAIDLAI